MSNVQPVSQEVDQLVRQTSYALDRLRYLRDLAAAGLDDEESDPLSVLADVYAVAQRSLRDLRQSRA